MGYGSYSLEAHQAIVASRDAATMRFATAFDPKMNPLGAAPRESRDSEAHPNSLSIIFALDVSTSMGAIPRSLATKTLPTFMEATLSVVPDPQILFMAFTDARYWQGHNLSLQVGQFESVVLEDADDTAVVAATLLGIGEGVLRTQAEIEARVEAAFGRQGEARDRIVRAVLPYAEARARGPIAPPEPLSQRTDCIAAAL